MDAPDWNLAVLTVTLLILAVAVLLYMLRHRRDEQDRDQLADQLAALAAAVKALAQRLGVLEQQVAVLYGNPDPGHITEAMWWLWQQLQILEPETALSGIYANKPGYHNARSNLPSYDYSVVDPPDRGGPGWAACAIDWTFPDAQGGDYSTISVYTRRLIDSGRDPDDPRLNGWREVYGNADWDTYVEGYDFRYQQDVTSDSSHLWHIHLSENRDQSESYDNKKALLSVLAGEPWPPPPEQMGEAVILNDPNDPGRLDLLWVGPGGEVWHRWYPTGGMSALWSAQGSKEKLGGGIVPGTLSASWAHDGSGINIVGLGVVDVGGDAPAECGQYWGYWLGRDGEKSGWGSLDQVYGLWPSAVP